MGSAKQKQIEAFMQGVVRPLAEAAQLKADKLNRHRAYRAALKPRYFTAQRGLGHLYDIPLIYQAFNQHQVPPAVAFCARKAGYIFEETPMPGLTRSQARQVHELLRTHYTA